MTPGEIATTLKDGSERALREEYRELRALAALWAGYLATTAKEFPHERLQRFVEDERQAEGDRRVIITTPPRSPFG